MSQGGVGHTHGHDSFLGEGSPARSGDEFSHHIAPERVGAAFVKPSLHVVFLKCSSEHIADALRFFFLHGQGDMGVKTPFST